MKHLAAMTLVVLLAIGCSTLQKRDANEGWISLFDGKSLDGWKVNENPATFSVRDDAIVARGQRAHLFYAGPVENHDFKNFAFKSDVMTRPKSNSGIYFHTAYQERGWPNRGYEAQVNNSQPTEPKKTGSLYGVVDVLEAPAEDNTWFTEEIIVRGKHIIIKVDGKTLVDYTEPQNLGETGRRLSHGTFALQGHDPGSEVHFKNIMVKPLPD